MKLFLILHDDCIEKKTLEGVGQRKEDVFKKLEDNMESVAIPLDNGGRQDLPMANQQNCQTLISKGDCAKTEERQTMENLGRFARIASDTSSVDRHGKFLARSTHVQGKTIRSSIISIQTDCVTGG